MMRETCFFSLLEHKTIMNNKHVNHQVFTKSCITLKWFYVTFTFTGNILVFLSGFDPGENGKCHLPGTNDLEECYMILDL